VAIQTELTVWPGGKGAGARKLKLFNDRMIGLALFRLGNCRLPSHPKTAAQAWRKEGRAPTWGRSGTPRGYGRHSYTVNANGDRSVTACHNALMTRVRIRLVPNTVLLPLLAVILMLSALKVWRQR